jgi:trans-aconitate 2-methyltransferase
MALGHEVLERTQLRGDEVVLDAGCGSGELTAELAARVPDGRVYAVDGSPRMAALARERLGERATIWVGDLLELEVPEPVDLVFSAATFHWIDDHERLFERLHAALKPGGRLVAQCGGFGNIARVRAAILETGDAWNGPWTFATPDDTRRRLEAAGFRDVETWLHDEPTPIEPGDPLREYLRTVILGAHLDRLSPAAREPFVAAVAERLPDGVIDYVRLNILATRA